MTVGSLKKIAFLAPKPGLSDAEFRAYWRGTHGPLVGGSPGYADWRRRYVQNHILANGPVGQPLAHSGMAEFWLPGDDPNEDAYAQTALYRDRIRVDELNFIDMDRTVSMTAREEIRLAGTAPGSAKLVVLSPPCADPFGATIPASALAGWSLDHILPGSFRLPGARRVGALPWTLIETLRLRDPGALAAVPVSLAQGRQSFLAEELVFFDASASQDAPVDRVDANFTGDEGLRLPDP